jgi:hypothetical protein
MNGPVVKAQVVEASASRTSPASRTPLTSPVSRWTGRPTETVFGMALVDRNGNLLGAGAASGLAGEVEVPLGVDLRRADLSRYFDGDLDGARGRRFPLVSATWVQVKSKRVRVGIYMERGDRPVNPERLDLDLGRIAAILGNQVVA